MDIQHRILSSAQDIELSTGSCGHPALADWVTSWQSCMLCASYGRLAAGKGRHAYIPIKMASGVQDISCVLEVAGSYEKNFNLTVSWDSV